MFKNNHSDPLEHKALERNASGNCCAFDLQKQGYLALLPPTVNTLINTDTQQFLLVI